MNIRGVLGYEKALGPDDTSTYGAVRNVGLLYSCRGNPRFSQPCRDTKVSKSCRVFVDEVRQSLQQHKCTRSWMNDGVVGAYFLSGYMMSCIFSNMLKQMKGLLAGCKD